MQEKSFITKEHLIIIYFNSCGDFSKYIAATIIVIIATNLPYFSSLPWVIVVEGM